MKLQRSFYNVLYLLGALSLAGLGLAVMMVALPAAGSEKIVSEDAIVWLDGPAGDVAVGEEITVTVRISDVVGLYGIDLSLNFTPTDMVVVDADEGEPGVQIISAECPEPDFQVKNVANNTVGTVEYVVTQLNPTPPFSGNCSVAYIRFEALTATTTQVSFDTLILSDNSFNMIPSTAVDLSINIVESTEKYVYLPMQIK